MFRRLKRLLSSRTSGKRQAHSVCGAGFTLLDPRPIAAEARYTFFLPSVVELEAIGQGDIVKLTFEYPGVTEKWAAERMWVLVDEADGENLTGKLENQPDEPTSSLSIGDPVAFRRHHVIAIQWAEPDKAPWPEVHREYWERCLVDQCVLDGEQPVEYLYREEPEPLPEGSDYPDSGWRIRGRTAGATDAEMDAREVAYVALGAVLNRDDSWIGWIDAPVETRLTRDFQADRYEEVTTS